eukprot:scaffold392_cov350-Prasinococcus_capsulatus_cf.AAC.11
MPLSLPLDGPSQHASQNDCGQRHESPLGDNIQKEREDDCGSSIVEQTLTPNGHGERGFGAQFLEQTHNSNRICRRLDGPKGHGQRPAPVVLRLKDVECEHARKSAA